MRDIQDAREALLREMQENDRPVYMISIAAEMLDVHPQTLRTYEKEGLILPRRSGGQRLYSRTDIEKLALILDLTRNLGVNRAGVDIILRMRKRLENLHDEMENMLSYIDEDSRRVFREKLNGIFEQDEDV